MIKLVLKNLKLNNERTFCINEEFVNVTGESIKETNYISEAKTEMEEALSIINANRLHCEVVSLEVKVEWIESGNCNEIVVK